MSSVSPLPLSRFVLMSLALCSLASSARAQVLGLDPSVQSAGMGGATVAAFWLDQPNSSINPALMGFQRGITYSFGTTDIPSSFPFVFSSEAKFQTHQIALPPEQAGRRLDQALAQLLPQYSRTRIQRWIDEVTAQGIDGAGLVKMAREGIAKHGGGM